MALLALVSQMKAHAKPTHTLIIAPAPTIPTPALVATSPATALVLMALRVQGPPHVVALTTKATATQKLAVTGLQPLR